MPDPRPSRRGRGRGRGDPISATANSMPTRRRAGGRRLPHRSPRYRVVHFDVPTSDGREIISVDSHGLLAASGSGLDDGPVIPVGVDNDGSYFTDYPLPGEPFESLDQLIHAAAVHLLAAFSHDLPSYEEQQNVVGSASSQTPVPELQYLHYGASHDRTCEQQQQVGSKPVLELQHLYAEASSDLLFGEQQHIGGTVSSQMPVLQHLHAEASCDMLCEEQQQVGGAPSSQKPIPELQHLHAEASNDLLKHGRCAPRSSDLRCEELVAQTASSEMLQEQDVSSWKDLLNTATLDGLPINATSSSSVQSDAVAQDTIEVPPLPWHCLSSSPIWNLNRNDWGYTFYIRIDLKGLFHTYPRVGGPFQSLQQACSAIDCYLEEQRDTTMLLDQPGLSQVEKVVRQCLYWPDGTRKKRLKSQPVDEKRDWMRHLVQALVDKYNDYNHLLGDVAYEVKDVVRFQTVEGAIDLSRVHYHINFTIKTKGAQDSTCVINDLFFAEVTFKRGDAESVVSCFCTVKPTDNGWCYGCDVKHPNDAAAYTGGQISSSLGEYTKLGDIIWSGYNESFEEEEARVRRLYEPQGLW